MTPSRRLLRAVLETDTLSVREPGGWITRCIHCRSRLRLEEPFDGRTAATLEHIVPSSWFGESNSKDLTGDLDGPDDLRNLAVACARCNHDKGMGPDARGPSDPSAKAIVRRLRELRTERYEAPNGGAAE